MTDGLATFDHDTDLSDAPEALPDGMPEVDSDALPEVDSRGSSAPTSKGESSRRAVEAKLIRRAIAKHEELRSADPSELAIVAALAGTKPDPADVTVAVLTGGRIDVGPVTELVSLAALAESDPLEAMFVAVGLDRESAKQQWALLIGVGAADGNLPARDRDAAKAIVQAAGNLDAAQRARLGAVRTLLKK